MREILFRGKLLRDGHWAEGNLDIKKSGVCIITPDETPLGSYGQVDPETVGQYTGMIANGKRIFEGDILRDVITTNGEVVIGVVSYTDGAFGVKSKRGAHFLVFFENGEIIGNIHDNPEMIGGQEDGK